MGAWSRPFDGPVESPLSIGDDSGEPQIGLAPNVRIPSAVRGVTAGSALSDGDWSVERDGTVSESHHVISCFEGRLSVCDDQDGHSGHEMHDEIEHGGFSFVIK